MTMCGIYSSADPILYESRSRSVRIHGVVTSIRLENLFWDVLAAIARGESMSTNKFIAKLYDEILQHHGEVPNLASFLRVSCLRHLALTRASDRSPEMAPFAEALTDAPASVVQLARQRAR
jgi:predicted DNA-binding ribbon-helix-helix protein